MNRCLPHWVSNSLCNKSPFHSLAAWPQGQLRYSCVAVVGTKAMRNLITASSHHQAATFSCPWSLPQLNYDYAYTCPVPCSPRPLSAFLAWPWTCLIPIDLLDDHCDWPPLLSLDLLCLPCSGTLGLYPRGPCPTVTLCSSSSSLTEQLQSQIIIKKKFSFRTHKLRRPSYLQLRPARSGGTCSKSKYSQMQLQEDHQKQKCQTAAKIVNSLDNEQFSTYCLRAPLENMMV